MSVDGHPLTAQSLPTQAHGVSQTGSVGSQIAAIQPPSLLTSPSRAAAPAPPERCTRCGRDGHTQSHCFAATSVDGRALTAETAATSRPELRLGNVPSQAATGVNPFHAAAAVAAHPSSWGAPPLQPHHPSQTSQLTQPLFQSQPPGPSLPVRCPRCGRDGHTQSRCFAATSVDGRALTAEPPATSRPELRLGNVPSQAATVPNPFHATAAVAAHPSSWAPPLQPSQPSQTSQLTQPLFQYQPPPPAPSVRCSRCGRDGHTQSRCFASTSVDGRALTAETAATSRPELRLGNVPSQAATGVNPFHAAAAVAAHPSSWGAPPLQPHHPSQTSQLTQPLFQSQPPGPSLPVRCPRCGRDGHTQSRCFAATSVDGRALTAEPPATSRPELRLGNVPSQAATVPNPFHAAAAVAAHPSSWAPPLQPHHPSQTSQLTQPLFQSQPPQVSRPPQLPPPVPSAHCTRCGRDSHTRSECFASTHISGRHL
eukprot:gene12307-8800_t